MPSTWTSQRVAGALEVGRGGGLVTAASFGVQGGGASEAVCRSDGEGGCLKGPPELLSMSTLAGWQSAGEMIRVMPGPILAIDDDESAGLGVTSRLDLCSLARLRRGDTTGPEPSRWLTMGAGLSRPEHQMRTRALFPYDRLAAVYMHPSPHIIAQAGKVPDLLTAR